VRDVVQFVMPLDPVASTGATDALAPSISTHQDVEVVAAERMSMLAVRLASVLRRERQ
jgi:hypothetical protein